MENEYFPEICDILGVQHPKRQQFSSKEAPLNRQDADYRRIRVYTKSLARYRKERERRRKMRLLADKGLSQKQIAKELGVSTRTVKRDWDKVRSYVKGQCNKELKEIMEQKRQEFEQRFEGLPLKEELKRLRHNFKEASRVTQTFRAPATLGCHELAITLQLDDQSPDGFPHVEIFPNQPKLSLLREFDLKINAYKSGQKRELCTLHFTLT